MALLTLAIVISGYIISRPVYRIANAFGIY